MALKQDDRALLQLVCERGQSYADLAGLLGISEDEVRAKARAALTELGGADPDAEVGLTDYLLGQADPIGRADAVRYLQDDAEARELAMTIATKLQALAPGASLPSIPEPRGRRRKPAAAAASAPAADAPTVTGPVQPASAPGAERTVSLSQHQTRLLVGIAAGGLILVFAILAIAGVFGGGGSSSSGASADATAAAAQRDITPVKLSPVGNSGVAGRADFGLANDQLVVNLKLSGLDPKPPKGDVYVIWLMLNDKLGYPVNQLQPDANGSVSSSTPVPTPVAVAVGGNAQSVLVSRTPAKQLSADIKKAVKASVPVLQASGKPLATGDIPLAKGGSGSALGSGSGAGASTTTPSIPSTTTPSTTTSPGG